MRVHRLHPPHLPQAPEARRLAGRARGIWSELGPAGVAVRALQRVVPRRVLFLDWYALYESWSARPGTPIEDGVHGARWASPGDAPSLAALVNSAEVVAGRLAGGDRAALVEQDGRPVAQLFFAQRLYDENGLQYITGDDVWWVYDGYVAPAARGRRLHGRLFCAALDALGSPGHPVRGVSAIDMLNVASRHSADRRGSRVIGRVLALTVAGFTLSGVRWVGERTRWRVHRGAREVPLPGPSAPAAG